MVTPLAGGDRIVVVGGGPAGLAVAIGAKLAGHEVVVLDRRQPPIDAACGEGIMPAGLAALDELGVDIAPEQERPFAGIRFLDGAVVAEGRFPGRPGLGIRRTVLHQAMVERAAAVGVELRWGVAVRGLLTDGVETDGGAVRGRWLVGADGRNSQLRQWAGLARPAGRNNRFGVRRHFRVRPWSDLVEVHWVDGAEAYVTPVAAEQVGVALLAPGGDLRFDQLLARFPALVERLGAAEADSQARGAGPFDQGCRAVARGRLGLVGAAAACLDAISGEGLTLALLEARALVAALGRGDLRSYVAAHRAGVRQPRRLTALLVLLAAHPRLRRRVVARLAAELPLMSRYLAFAAAGGSARLFGSDGLAALVVATLAGAPAR